MNYIIAHIPHSSTEVPHRSHYVGDVEAEQALVTDWATDRMVDVDEELIFPYSRLWCDVERLVDDPLDKRGLGIFVTHRLNGEVLRTASSPYTDHVMADYHAHHKKLVELIFKAISLMPVCLLDIHSYSKDQAVLMGATSNTYPEICLGFDRTPAKLIDQITAICHENGLSVGLNEPFLGALTPDAFRDNPDFFAIMIEVNKSVYLNADNSIDDERFAKLKMVLKQVVEIIRSFNTGA